MSGFRKASGSGQAAIKALVYGAGGSGKTFTAHLCCEGLAGVTGRRTKVIDTEYGSVFYAKEVPERSIHPAAFDFDVLETRSLMEIKEAVESLGPDDAGQIIIDSATHVWQSARAAFEATLPDGRNIPISAWAQIKRPYAELMTFLLNSPFHVFVLARETNEMAEDSETNELRVVGKRPDVEKSTPYDPHIILRMDPIRSKKGSYTYRAFVEKDRTGILAGNTIEWPGYDSLCAPIMPLLGGTQAHVATETETATKDAVALSDIELAKRRISDTFREEFEAKFKLCKTIKELGEVSKQLTPAVKKQMLSPDVTALREYYRQREQILSGGLKVEPVS